MKKSILIHPDELSKVWIDRMVRENIDVLALHPPGGSKAHEYIEKMLVMLEDPEYRALLDYAAEQGLKIEYEMHAAGYLLPKELFASHPEYFRMNEKGERVPDMNFCVSNEEALRLVLKNAAALAGKTIVPFATSGGSGMGDSTANLQALAPKAKVTEGRRFRASADADTLKAWAAEITK